MAFTPLNIGTQTAQTSAGAAPTPGFTPVGQTAPVAAPVAAPQNADSIWLSLAKSIASPVATIAARPFQALSDAGDYLGTKIEADKAGAQGHTQVQAAILAQDHQKEIQNQTQATGPGGIIAPTPANAADVKKDVGRGIQTVALGLGPAAGGAAFGLGDSLEKGNDLFSPTTAVETLAGLAGGKVLDLIGTPIFNAVGKVAGKITPELLQQIAAKGTTAIADFAAEHNILPEMVSHVINSAADTADAIANKPFSATADLLKTGANKVQVAAARGSVPGVSENVTSPVQTSAERLAQQAPLIGAGAAREAKPLDMYNSFANAEDALLGNKKLGIKGDIKMPGAQGKLGDMMSGGFEQVIGLRRTAGEAMGTALKTIADKPTDIAAPTQNFVQHLADDFNLGYNPLTKEFSTVRGDQSPLTSDDRQMLTTYLDELGKLGTNPSVGSLDAFMKRIPNELDVAKAAKNITKVTPAEAAIKGNLSSLRGELDAKINPDTGIAQKPYLQDYTKAKKDYARLSGIVDRGSTLLGGKDSEGNYIRDASVAKRAVQSIADGGTKDLLLSIEKETGIPLLDNANLALQAMKDAGNPMGHSLLELVTNAGKGVPTDAQTLTERLIRAGGSVAKGKIIGSPADQTRALLKALENAAKKAKK